MQCPGTCIFIDIVNSTNVKYKNNIEDWGVKLHNTFRFISFLNNLSENIVKGIGDEIMIFIPDQLLKEHSNFNDYYSLLDELYSTLYNLKNYIGDKEFLECKIGIHYCEDVYNISFLKGYNDYNGKDIDLTARLMSKTIPNRIVLSEEYYKKVVSDFSPSDNNTESIFYQISGKYLEDFKGVPVSTEFRVIDV